MNENFWMGMLGLAIVFGSLAAVFFYSHWREKAEREGYFEADRKHDHNR